MPIFEGVLSIAALGVAVAAVIFALPIPWPLRGLWLLCDAAFMTILYYWYVSEKQEEQFLSVIKQTFDGWSKAKIGYMNNRIVIVVENESRLKSFQPVWELPHFVQAERFLKQCYKGIYDEWAEAEQDVQEYNRMIESGSQDQGPLAKSPTEYKFKALERMVAFRTHLKELSGNIELGKKPTEKDG